MSPKVRPLVALLLGTVLGLCLLEAGLWIASAFVRAPPRVAHKSGEPAILCVGDSNTYGIQLEAEDSYPGQLQAFLDAAGRSFSVVNQGYPGQNSAQVRSGLVEGLAEVEPEVVVVWVGVNDRWSEAEKHVWSAESGFWSGLFQRSRVVKLARLLATSGDVQAATSGAPDGARGDARLGDGRFEAASQDEMHHHASEETRASIRANLEAMADLCEARGARLFFVTYPIYLADVMADVNGTIRAVAAERGLELVDLEARFRTLAENLPPDVVYLHNDTHLSPVGNHEAARQVLLALARAGSVEVAEPPPPLEERFDELGIEVRRAGEALVVTLTGPPEWKWRLQLDSVHARPAHPEFGRVHIDIDEEGLSGKEQRRWIGRFDAAGRARTEIHAPQAPADESWQAWEITAVAQGPERRDCRFSAPARVPSQ